MKLILILTAFITVSNASATEFLTSSQESNVLEAIDNICGDTWCEGDFDYSFDKINCSVEDKSCELSFVYIYKVWNEEINEEVTLGTAPMKCTLSGIASYEDMIDIERQWLDLSYDFYEKVTECVTDNEDTAYDTIDMGY